MAVFLNDFLMRTPESAFETFKNLKRFVSQSAKCVEVLPFSTENETPVNVSGNLNALQSSVNITDGLQAGLSQEKIAYITCT